MFGGRAIYRLLSEKLQPQATIKAADKVQECTGCVKSEDDLFVCGTQTGLMPLPSETSVFHPSEFYETWTVEAPTADVKHFLQHSSGWQNSLRPADLASS